MTDSGSNPICSKDLLEMPILTIQSFMLRKKQWPYLYLFIYFFGDGVLGGLEGGMEFLHCPG